MKTRIKKIVIVAVIVLVAAFLLIQLADWCIKATYNYGLGGSPSAEEMVLIKQSISENCAKINKLLPADKQLNPATWELEAGMPDGDIFGWVSVPKRYSAQIAVWRNNGALIRYIPKTNETIAFSDPMEFMEKFFRTVRSLPPGPHVLKTEKNERSIDYTWERYNENGVRYWGDDTVFSFYKDGKLLSYRSGPGYPLCNDQPVLTPDDAFMRASYEIMRSMKDYPRPGHRKPIDVKLIIHDPVKYYRSLGFGVIGHPRKEFGVPRLVYAVLIKYSIDIPRSYTKVGPNDILIDAITGEVVFNPTSWFTRNFHIVW